MRTLLVLALLAASSTASGATPDQMYRRGTNVAYIGYVGVLGYPLAAVGYSGGDQGQYLGGIAITSAGAMMVAGGSMRARRGVQEQTQDMVPAGAGICAWVGALVITPLGYACGGGQLATNSYRLKTRGGLSDAGEPPAPRKPKVSVSIAPAHVERRPGLLIGGRF